MRGGKLMNLVVRVIKKVHPRFGLRDSDIILASYPKSGNTWVRFIWANIVSLKELGGRTIDFHFINKELAAEYDTHSFGSIQYNCLPRLVKTHMEYDRRFDRNQTIHLYRNPGDTMLSYYEYKSSERSSEVDDISLSEFVRHPKYGMPAWCRHVDSWIDKCDVAISYEGLKEDALEVVRGILDRLDHSGIEEEIVKCAVDRSSFKRMRAVEEERGRPALDEGRFSREYRFTNKARFGEWKRRLPNEDVRYLEQMLSKWGLGSEGGLWESNCEGY